MSRAVAATLRVPDKSHRRFLFHPCAHTMRTKGQDEILGATESIPAIPLQGITLKGHVLRVQTDRGTEWMHTSALGSASATRDASGGRGGGANPPLGGGDLAAPSTEGAPTGSPPHPPSLWDLHDQAKTQGPRRSRNQAPTEVRATWRRLHRKDDQRHSKGGTTIEPAQSMP